MKKDAVISIWLVQTGEEMESDPGGPRLLRTAILAEELMKLGHSVTFFNSTFNHQKKIQRFNKTTVLCKSGNFKEIFLFGNFYSKNISIKRIVSQIRNGFEFHKIAKTLPKPDVILCGLPTLELSAAVARYAKAKQVPMAIDCRDMWPDIFLAHLPYYYSLLFAPIIWFYSGLKRYALSNATAIIGITDEMIRWGLQSTKRKATRFDMPFHLAVSPLRPEKSQISTAKQNWISQIGKQKTSVLIGCFQGTLSNRLDIQTFIHGLNLVDKSFDGMYKIVLCGKGDLHEFLVKKLLDNKNVIYAGWRNAADLSALLSLADFGILPYPNTLDVRASYPNKVGEYLSAGLPIMTGLGGLTGILLAKNGLGIPYTVGDATSVARAIEGAIADVTRLRGLNAIAQAVYRDMFDPEVIYPAFCDYLEDLAAAGPNARSFSASE